MKLLDLNRRNQMGDSVATVSSNRDSYDENCFLGAEVLFYSQLTVVLTLTPLSCFTQKFESM